MGQYYHIIMKKKDEDEISAFDRTLDGEDYVGAKLMEHSWYNNNMVNAIAQKLHNTPTHLAWVGDYADDNIKGNEINPYHEAWERKSYSNLKASDFTLNGRYLVNHSKKLILDCWMYLIQNVKNSKDRWIIHPLPLLTACGNGRGGGDYEGTNMDQVGSWAWDVLEIVEWNKQKSLLNDGYKMFEVLFNENR